MPYCAGLLADDTDALPTFTYWEWVAASVAPLVSVCSGDGRRADDSRGKERVAVESMVCLEELADRCVIMATQTICALPVFAYVPPSAEDSYKPRWSYVLCAVCLEDIQADETMWQLLVEHNTLKKVIGQCKPKLSQDFGSLDYPSRDPSSAH
ncbi:hypothetical protein GUJ93_ZPchr0420g40547 [Zizania palustris]|uniref:Uncharacterized protein n=1 Tax=Zizania palustris TaxID=103762 RepID=A0A8J5RD05_ZIZPA|nr:hypothetical protein GUJ93_ZPchr0420g40547 [Zizania palustris]